ncbi:MAG TPA: ADP-forming succinate--CoA ligase subunit beta [Chloroflexota bacterium]|nr:ADP-forming succinate--CoA ligase subunit beta [Chloroflexota bacterium]
MKLHEYQGKELFRRQGMPVPQGVVASTPADVAAAAREMGRVVIKAQVHVGGRGKAGGVKVANTPDEAEEIASRILGMNIKGLTVHKVLVEPALDIAIEYYAGIVNDRSSKRFVLMLSALGGVDIEEVAATQPDKIVKVAIDPAFGVPDYLLRQAAYDAGFDPAYHKAILPVLKGLYAALVANDAMLVEVNPLVITGDGKVVVADAKVDIDDNALFRHPELMVYREESFDNEMDRQAAEQGLTYVHLGGSVGIIGNGAGLVMQTLDVVNAAGLKPANFLDIGGGAQAAQVTKAMSMVLSDPGVKAVIFNIFGGITRADEVAKGMLAATEQMDIPVPVVVRLSGTQEEAGRALLEGSRFIPAANVQEAAQKVKELLAAHP